MNQYDIVTATFMPKNLDTLKPAAAHWIGWRGEWSADWKVENGAHEGEWAMCVGESSNRPPFIWTHLSDLADIEYVPKYPSKAPACDADTVFLLSTLGIEIYWVRVQRDALECYDKEGVLICSFPLGG